MRKFIFLSEILTRFPPIWPYESTHALVGYCVLDIPASSGSLIYVQMSENRVMFVFFTTFFPIPINMHINISAVFLYIGLAKPIG